MYIDNARISFIETLYKHATVFDQSIKFFTYPMEQKSQRTQLRYSTQSQDPENTKLEVIKHLRLSQDKRSKTKNNIKLLIPSHNVGI